MIPDTDDLEISSEGRSDKDPNLQTGLFLQQFTNSVSRALYKERCAIKGHHLQITSSTERLDYKDTSHGPPVLQSANCFLPSIHTLNNIQRQLSTYQNARTECNKTSRKVWRGDYSPILKTSPGYTDHHKGQFQKYTNFSNAASASQISFNGNSNSSSRHKLKTPRGLLQKSITTMQGSLTNLELPKIMNIRDVKGNTWEIQEDASHEVEPLPKTNSVLPEVNIHHNTDHIHRVTVKPSKSKRVSFDRVNMAGKNSNYEDVIFVETDRPSVPPNTINTAIADSLEPSCGVPPTNATRVHCMSDSDLHYHDEFERNKILQRLNSEARVRKITYNDYIQQLSLVQYCSCQREKMIIPETDVDWHREENRAIYTRQGVPLFPPELEELYTRSNLTVSTMDINGVVNKRGDFQQQQEDEIMSNEVSSFRPYSKQCKSRLRFMYKCSIQVNDQPNGSKFYLKGTGVDRTKSKISGQRFTPNHRFSPRNPNEKGPEVDVSKRSLKPFGERDPSNVQSSKPTFKCSGGRSNEPAKLKMNQIVDIERDRIPKNRTVLKEPYVKIQAMNPLFGKTELNSEIGHVGSESIENHGYLARQPKPEKTKDDSQEAHCSTMAPFILESVSGVGFGAQRRQVAAPGCSCNGHHEDHIKVAVTNVVFTSPVAMV